MAMVSSYQKSFLSPIPLASAIHNPKKFRPKHLLPCRSSSEKDVDPSSTSANDNRLARLAIVTLAAGVLTLGSVHDAMAAKSGGRVGGQAFRSAAPRASSPRITGPRTNIYVNPPVAPPLFGGYGYGGWGWSPFSFFVPGPSVAVGVGGGLDFFVVLLVLSAVATVVRRFTTPRDDEDDY